VGEAANHENHRTEIERIRMGTPDRSPLLAPNVVCFTCGDVLKPKPVMGPRGVDHIEYECRNKKHEPYRMESTAMLQAEMRPVRPDGSAVKL
jgi:hypothetical protein